MSHPHRHPAEDLPSSSRHDPTVEPCPPIVPSETPMPSEPREILEPSDGKPVRQPAMPSPLPAVGLIGASVLSTQTGAGFAKELFTAIAPTAATFLRLLSAALALAALLAARRLLAHRFSRLAPRPLPASRDAWLVGLAWGACLVGMNWSFYQAAARLPLGIAVTIEYLGPLAVSVLGRRRRLDLLWAALAALGVGLLGLRPQPLDGLGVVFVLIAGACWAGYLILGGRTRQTWDSGHLLGLSCLAGAVVLAGPALRHPGGDLASGRVLALGVLVGLLSSALPYTLELIAMGAVRPGVMATIESLSPAVAALAAWVIVGELLTPLDTVAIVAVMVACAGASLGVRRRPSPR